MKAKMRSKYLVAMTQVVLSEGKGVRHRAKKPETGSVAVYKQVITPSGPLYIPANAAAAHALRSMSTDERVAIVTSSPPPASPALRECESTRILGGARFKELPKGVQERDVFQNDGSAKPIRPVSTGSLARTFVKQPNIRGDKRARAKLKKQGTPAKQAIDPIDALAAHYQLSHADATLLFNHLSANA